MFLCNFQNINNQTNNLFDSNSSGNSTLNININSNINFNPKFNSNYNYNFKDNFKDNSILDINSSSNSKGNSPLNLNANIQANNLNIENLDFLSNLFLNSNESKLTSCPHCTSSNFIKYGSFKNIQRFKCKDCERTFSTKTNSICYYSKKDFNLWKEFCILQLQCHSLSFCSKLLKINIATAFYWRHKFLNALKRLTSPEMLSNHVFMIHYFIKESFKGSKNAPKSPRVKLWSIFSYDNCDNSLTIPYCKDHWNKTNFEKLVYAKIHPKTYISVHGNNYIQAMARNHNKKLKKPSNMLNENRVQDILLSYLYIIRKTRGIATKYLPQYLALVKAHILTKTFDINFILKAAGNSDYYIKCNKVKLLRALQ